MSVITKVMFSNTETADVFRGIDAIPTTWLNGFIWVNHRFFRRVFERFLDKAHYGHTVAPRVFEIDSHLAVFSDNEREGFVEPPGYQVA